MVSLFLRDDAAQESAGRKPRERERERGVAPRALITFGGLLKLQRCLRLSPPLRDNYY